MTTLRDDIAVYDSMRSELEAEHLGKWALVFDRTLVGTFDDFEAAAAEAVRRFGRGPYLIRQIGASAARMPASVIFGPLHASDPVRL